MKTRRILATLACCFFAAACGKKDSPTGPSGSATAAEVSAMMSALSAAGAFTVSPAYFTGAGGATSFDVTSPCPSGGTVQVTGNYTVNTTDPNVFIYNATVTQVYSGCKAPGNGTVFTFSGTGLTVTFDMNYNIAAGSYNYTMRQTGNLGWASPSNSGTCPVDINVSYSVTSSTVQSYTYTGTYCGINIAM